MTQRLLAPWLTPFLLMILLPFSAQSKVLEKIYAVVNGETITLTEISD